MEKLYQRENYIIQKQHGRAVPIICVLEDISFCRQNHRRAVSELLFGICLSYMNEKFFLF